MKMSRVGKQLLSSIAIIAILQAAIFHGVKTYGADCNYFLCCCRPYEIVGPMIGGPGANGQCKCNPQGIGSNKCESGTFTPSGEPCGGSGFQIAYKGLCLEDPDGDENCIEDAGVTVVKIYEYYYGCTPKEGFNICGEHYHCECKLKKTVNFREIQITNCYGVACPPDAPS